jgi:hypothetical protein
MLEPKPLDCRAEWYGGRLLSQTDGSQMKFGDSYFLNREN